MCVDNKQKRNQRKTIEHLKKSEGKIQLFTKFCPPEIYASLRPCIAETGS